MKKRKEIIPPLKEKKFILDKKVQNPPQSERYILTVSEQNYLDHRLGDVWVCLPLSSTYIWSLEILNPGRLSFQNIRRRSCLDSELYFRKKCSRPYLLAPFNILVSKALQIVNVLQSCDSGNEGSQVSFCLLSKSSQNPGLAPEQGSIWSMLL